MTSTQGSDTAKAMLSTGDALAASRLLIAERFIATCPGLHEVVLPLDVVARSPVARLMLLVVSEATGVRERRVAILPRPDVSERDRLTLRFAPFRSEPGDVFLIGALDADPAIEGAGDPVVAWLRSHIRDRDPIVLECRGSDATRGGEVLVDEERMFVTRTSIAAVPSIRTAHWIDAFWCDASGISLRGWVHAYEHRVRALRLEVAGRSSRVDTFTDRPDVLLHYPEHEHVRFSGFSIYLGCPPGHPATLVVETDAGVTAVPFVLPGGPVPPWPEEPDAGDTLTPLLRRFVELVNIRRGRVLQIGSRIPAGAAPIPPRDLLHGLIGVDIHPGCNVDVVGDAHTLSSFIRPGSVDGVLSSSVLEHIQAPWLVAAEINRVLKVGGLVYQHVPAAWPAHAQPNDFWRFSSEGLRVLFGSATGFEILAADDSARAAIVPSPAWRTSFLDMPVTPSTAMAEVLARKVEDIRPGAVAWPLAPRESESRSHQYPVEGLRPRTPESRS